jgi:heme exporter protein A
VRLSRVTRLFDGLAAVTQVSLEVAQGETVWLRGWNGSGKTTLLRLIATAISPTFGGGSVLGFDLRAERSAIRARADLLSHETRLYGDLTAAENLRFACSLYDIDPRLAESALGRVGLEEVAAVRVARFSQGMRQRLALARCLMRGPALILLDEPYAALDVEARVVDRPHRARGKRETVRVRPVRGHGCGVRHDAGRAAGQRLHGPLRRRQLRPADSYLLQGPVPVGGR